MSHFPFYPTPIHKLKNLSKEFGVDLYIKRDDLFVKAGGGSKVRMLQYILFKAINLGHDCILTAGEPFSNFNRALALMCGIYKLKFRLVIFNSHPELTFKSLNQRICEFCKVDYVTTSKEKVAETLEAEKLNLIKEGYKPYYIWGGGKSPEGVMAYFDCIGELKTQIDFLPDYIVTALGTGTTFSGLVAGCRKYFPNTKVIGISIARFKEKAKNEVELLLKDFDKSLYSESEYVIYDDFLMGGYGYTNDKMEDFLEYAINMEGIIFDKIYVGKALYGLSELIKSDPGYKCKKIIFINTGGIYNF